MSAKCRSEVAGPAAQRRRSRAAAMPALEGILTHKKFFRPFAVAKYHALKSGNTQAVAFGM
jgi:hypothetical protein